MIKNIIFTIIIMGVFLGCSKNMPDYSSKQYHNVNKDAVLNAAKRVILLADREYLVHSKRNSVEAQKTIANYRGFNVDLLINNIDFKVVQEDNITKAKLKLTIQKDYLTTKPEVVKNDAHIIFWNRLEYILGLQEKWPTCLSYRAKMNFDGIFCNLLHNDNLTPSKSTNLTDIAINKYEDIIVEEDVSLATLDLSILETIQLPLENINDTKEELIEVFEDANETIENNITLPQTNNINLNDNTHKN
jgi:hypothetical protein